MTFDTVGGDVFLRSLDATAINDQAVTVLGASSSTADRGQCLLYRNISVHYEFMGIPTAYEIEPERPGQILASIARLVEASLLRPQVSHRFPLERVANGHRQVETSRTVGKVTILVKPA